MIHTENQLDIENHLVNAPDQVGLLGIPTPPSSVVPSDFVSYKLSSPDLTKSPERSESLSPVSTPGRGAALLSRFPPTLSLSGMFPRSHHNFGSFPNSFPLKDSPRLPEEYLNMHRAMQERSYNRSPPSQHSPNDPESNNCKIVEYRGEKIASFIINGKSMLCLPQAFELFLKNLVGGLHTVYTKLKRLDISPIICNVEQVRVLRGLGAIQPGVNRCKLLAETDFDELFKDCTTNSSRPGRPPKRMMPYPMSPQDLMLHQMKPHSDPFLDHLRTNSNPMDQSPHRPPFPGPLPPHMNPLLGLGSPATAQVAQAALLSRNGVMTAQQRLPPMMPENFMESYKQSYGDMIKHLQGIQREQVEQSSLNAQDKILLGQDNPSQPQSTDSASLKSESDIGDDNDMTSDDNMHYDDEEKMIEEKKNIPEDGKMYTEDGKMGSMFHLMNHIQSLINTAVENAKHEEQQLLIEKSNLKGDLSKEKDSIIVLRKKIEDEKKNSDMYLRRFKKEKKLRKRLQYQLKEESKKLEPLEAALKSLSYESNNWPDKILDSFSNKDREREATTDPQDPRPSSPNYNMDSHLHSSPPYLPANSSPNLPVSSLIVSAASPLLHEPVTCINQLYNQAALNSPIMTNSFITPLLATNVR